MCWTGGPGKSLEQPKSTLEHPFGRTRLPVAEGREGTAPFCVLVSVPGGWLHAVLPPGNQKSCPAGTTEAVTAVGGTWNLCH